MHRFSLGIAWLVTTHKSFACQQCRWSINQGSNDSGGWRPSTIIEESLRERMICRWGWRRRHPTGNGNIQRHPHDDVVILVQSGDRIWALSYSCPLPNWSLSSWSLSSLTNLKLMGVVTARAGDIIIAVWSDGLSTQGHNYSSNSQ